MKTAELSYKQNKQAFPKAGTAEYQALQQQAAVYLVTQDGVPAAGRPRSASQVTDADVTAALAALVKQRFKGDQKKFDAYLKTTGYTLAQFRDGERRQLIGNRLTKAVTKDVKVSAAEVKAYYDKNKASAPYTTPAQRRVRHILVALNAKGVGVAAKGVTDTKVDFAKSKALADKLYTQLKARRRLRRRSSRSTRRIPARRRRAASTPTSRGRSSRSSRPRRSRSRRNEISKPVKSQFGYHLIQALGADQARRDRVARRRPRRASGARCSSRSSRRRCRRGRPGSARSTRARSSTRPASSRPQRRARPALRRPPRSGLPWPSTRRSSISRS